MTDLLAIAVSLGVMALAVLVFLTRRDIQLIARDLMVHRETSEHAPQHGDLPEEMEWDTWPPDCVVKIGKSLPGAISEALRAIDRGGSPWKVLLALDAELDSRLTGLSETVLPALDSHYEVVRLVTESIDGDASLPCVVVEADLFETVPRPSVMLVDSDHVVQGVGRISHAEEVLAFVREGELHGYGAP